MLLLLKTKNGSKESGRRVFRIQPESDTTPIASPPRPSFSRPLAGKRVRSFMTIFRGQGQTCELAGLRVADAKLPWNLTGILGTDLPVGSSHILVAGMAGWGCVRHRVGPRSKQDAGLRAWKP